MTVNFKAPSGKMIGWERTGRLLYWKQTDYWEFFVYRRKGTWYQRKKNIPWSDFCRSHDSEVPFRTMRDAVDSAIKCE